MTGSGWLMQGVIWTAWGVAAAWVYKVIEAAVRLPGVANLLEERYDREPEGLPSLAVIVPGRNEVAGVRACLESLLAEDYAALRVFAVNDRSTDATGAVMEAVAVIDPARLSVIHVTELPENWLGKTHAMALAAAGTDAEWLLFTDADVLFRGDSLRAIAGVCGGERGRPPGDGSDGDREAVG